MSIGELFDRSPALRGSPGVTRLRGAGLMFAGRAMTPWPPRPFMVSGPLPATVASPNSARLSAAFTSRSSTTGHIMDAYVRSGRASLAFAAPHPERVLLDGNHRSTTTVRPPLHPVLYPSCWRILPNEASATCRASSWSERTCASGSSSGEMWLP